MAKIQDSLSEQLFPLSPKTNRDRVLLPCIEPSVANDARSTQILDKVQTIATAYQNRKVVSTYAISIFVKNDVGNFFPMSVAMTILDDCPVYK